MLQNMRCCRKFWARKTFLHSKYCCARKLNGDCENCWWPHLSLALPTLHQLGHFAQFIKSLNDAYNLADTQKIHSNRPTQTEISCRKNIIICSSDLHSSKTMFWISWIWSINGRYAESYFKNSTSLSYSNCLATVCKIPNNSNQKKKSHE